MMEMMKRANARFVFIVFMVLLLTTANASAVALEGSCTDDTDCSGTPHATICTDTDNVDGPDTCKCRTGFAPNRDNTTCKVAVGYLEGGCANTGACTRTENAQMCVNNKCKCNTGFMPNVGNTSCIADGALGGICSDHTNCTKTAYASICMCGKCACNPGYTVNSDDTACDAGIIALASTWMTVFSVLTASCVSL